MIQFNLLPQSKLEVVKAQQTQRRILLAAIVASIVAVVILGLSLLAVGVQKYSLSSASSDVTRYTNQLTQTPNLSTILTVQNQLKTLVSLHSQEPQVTRLFSYLPEITPTKTGISQLSVDFDMDTIQISGIANNLESINKFADTLKFTTYEVSSQNQQLPAFSSVTLSSFSKGTTGTNYTFNMSYAPALFDQSQDVTLTVPQNYISTQSFSKLSGSSLFNGSGAKQ